MTSARPRSVDRQPVGQHHLRGAPTVTQNHERDLATQTSRLPTSAPGARPAYGTHFTVAAAGSRAEFSVFTSAESCSNSGATYTMRAARNRVRMIANGGNANYSAQRGHTDHERDSGTSQTYKVHDERTVQRSYGN